MQGFGTISLADIAIDENQGSWFVSIDMIMAIIFTPIGGKMAEIIGIKKTFLLCSPLIVLGWILVGMFASTFALFSGRILTGIGVAILMVSPSIYIAEIAHPNGRAKLGSSIGFCFNLGIFILWFLGYFFSWQTIAFLSAIPSLTTFTGFLFLPDSPYRLIQNQRFEEALSALQYFRQNHDDKEVKAEFSEMLLQYKQKMNQPKMTIWSWIFSPAFYKPFLCIGILYPLYECCGTLMITNYMQSIMSDSKIELEPRTCSLILGFVRILSSGLTVLSIQKLPLKSTFVVLFTIKSLSLTTIAIYFFLQANHSEMVIHWTWIPLAMCCFIYGSHSFLLSINWILIGELFPSEIRNFTSGLIGFISYIPIFVTLKLFVEMKYAMGLNGVFFFYASVGFITTLYGAFTIPDFRTKSLVEIEKIYNSKTPLIPKQ